MDAKMTDSTASQGASSSAATFNTAATNTAANSTAANSTSTTSTASASKATPIPLQQAISESNQAAIPGADILAEILYSPNDNTCYYLDATANQELRDLEATIDGVMRELIQVSATEKFHSDALREAKAKLLTELNKISGAQSHNAEETPVLATGEAPEDFKFSEMISLSKKKYVLAPKTFLEKFEGKPKHFLKLHKSINSAVTESLEPVDLDEKKEKKDSIDKKLAKAVLKDVQKYLKDKVSAEWKLEYNKSGQMSSKLVAQGLSPWLAHFISDESFEVLDGWIETLNQQANASKNLHKKYIKNAIAALEKPLFKADKSVLMKDDPDGIKKYFIAQDWDYARRMVMDVWGEDSEIFLELSSFNFNDIKQMGVRENLIKKIIQEPLPRVQWDGSVGAQFMRYSMGATLGAEFTLWKKGSISVAGEVKADCALFEAKADGNFYIPHADGYALKPNVWVKKEILDYVMYGNTCKEAVCDVPDVSNLGKTNITNSSVEMPFFAVDCCLLTPAGASAVFGVLKAWDHTKHVAFKKALGGERQLFLQVAGHTSATGSEAYNKKLGALRAFTTLDFITQKTASWVGNFKAGVWGRAEIDFMAYSSLILGGVYRVPVDWSVIGNTDSKIPLIDQLLQHQPELLELKRNSASDFIPHYFLEGDIWEPTTSSTLLLNHLKSATSLSASEALEQAKVPRIQAFIERYFHNLYTFSCKENNLELSRFTRELASIVCHPVPAVSYGESILKEQNLGETSVNRRCEFVAYELKSVVKEAEAELYLGDIRCTLNGTLSAWAGANIQAGAKLELKCPKGMLQVKGTNALPDETKSGSGDKKTAEENPKYNKKKESIGAQANVNGAAFAGAKAEAGIKAIVDWRRPSGEAKKTFESANFKSFGSIGFTGTAMAGVGFNGNFTIGFDQNSGCFVIKMKAGLALGPGVGGELDIAVGTANLWEFAVFVFGEMERNNFSRIEIFETKDDESGTDVFDVFCSWAWKLFVVGAPGVGIAMVASYASQEILSNSFDLLRDWQRREADIENFESLVNKINTSPDMLKILLPETKARMFFELIAAPHSMKERFSNLWELDFDKKREDACKKLIFNAIHSKADWQETLEHIGEFQGDTFVPQVTCGASDKEKAARRSMNQDHIRAELLNDTDDWAEVEAYLANLPE